MVKAAVALSGGVDSSVTLALLKDRGYEVCGLTMKIWDGDPSAREGPRHACYGPGEAEDVEDARRLCESLGVPFYEFDLRKEYRAEVLDYYADEYLAGRTPNPCYRCNSRLKFGTLYSRARESGIDFDYFATGHYARVEKQAGGRTLLKKALDLTKDQSYFLSALKQEQLNSVLFPLGEFNKQQVRQLAADYGLEVANKIESQDFIAGDHLALVGPGNPGPMVDTSGRVIGEHRGLPNYTIGQRKGLGVTAEEPRYVTDIDGESNTVVIGGRKDVYRDELIASSLNWISIDKLEEPVRVKARIRYLHKEDEATVTPLDNGKVKVKFDRPQLAITPGQAVVFYQEDTVVGGGTIEKSRE